MGRLLVMIVAVVALGCAGGDDAGVAEGDQVETPTTVAAPAESGEWIDQFGAELEEVEVDGHRVWVDEGARTIYVEDCSVAESLTSEGGRFGPGERDPDTFEFEPGYGSVCRS